LPFKSPVWQDANRGATAQSLPSLLFMLLSNMVDDFEASLRGVKSHFCNIRQLHHDGHQIVRASAA